MTNQNRTISMERLMSSCDQTEQEIERESGREEEEWEEGDDRSRQSKTS